MSKNGLHLITPTSIVSTGTGNSSSISANGSVTFSTCETLSLNGVFSADYDNYQIVMRFSNSTASVGGRFRLRDNGTDNSTASSYTYQYLDALSTTVSGARSSLNEGLASPADANLRCGQVFFFYGPYLAQPTAHRVVAVADHSGGRIFDIAGTHNQSVAYDGATFYLTGGSFSGLVGVYGMRK